MWALHRALDGAPGYSAPEEWKVSRVCEEFRCMPDTAMQAMYDDPLRLIDTILALRNYTRIRDLVKRRIGGQKVEVPDSPIVTIVMRNIERAVLEDVERK